MRLHADNGVLYLESECLYVSVPEKPDNYGIQCSIRQIHAESLNTMTSLSDGRYMMNRCGRFGTFLNALAVLVGHCGSIHLIPDTCVLSEGDDAIVVPIHVSYNIRCIRALFLGQGGPEDRANAYESCHRLHNKMNSFQGGFSFLIRGKGIFELSKHIILPSCEWHWICKEHNVVLRFATTENEGSCGAIFFYLNGILARTEHLSAEFAQGKRIIVDCHSTSPHPAVSEVVNHNGCKVFLEFFLNNSVGFMDCKSTVFMIVCGILAPWAHVIRDLFDDEQVRLQVSMHRFLDDRIIPFVDCNFLMGTSSENSQLRKLVNVAKNHIGLQRNVHVQSSAISSSNFSKLYSAKAFNTFPMCSSEFVVVRDNVLVIPHDRENLSFIIRILLEYCPMNYGEACTPPSEVSFAVGTSYDEEYDMHGVEHNLNPYSLSCTNSGIRLALQTCNSNVEDCKLDDIVSEAVSTDESLMNRKLLGELFPTLCDRLISFRGDDVTVCLLEIKYRRVSSSWSFEDIENGSNLSYMGLTITAAVLLQLWAGAIVVVFLSPCTGYGLLSVKVGDIMKRFHCRTNSNTLDLVPSISNVSTCTMKCDIRKNSCIEVKIRTKWHLAIVLNVQKQHHSIKVRMLHNNEEHVINVHTHTWRSLQRGPDSDVDRTLKRLASQMNGFVS